MTQFYFYCGLAVDEQADKQLLSCDNFLLVINQVFVGRASSFLSAFSTLFAAYFVLNIEYPAEASATMEFVQK